MQALPIAHVGILVRDLEESRDHWSRALEHSFSPITRYRPGNWSDRGTPEPHLHDARLTFYLGDAPSIEILEFVGVGTHSPEKGEGGHHLSFPPLEDNFARRAELAELGIGTDGEIFHDGRWIFTFADAAPLNNVYTEWVEEHPDHADVKDDLSPINRMPDGSKTLFDVQTILDLDGTRPSSRMVEVGVLVKDLESAVTTWSKAVGYDFAVDEDRRAAVSTGFETALRLVELDDPAQREGIGFIVLGSDDLDATLMRLEAGQVPVRSAERDGGRLVRIVIEPAFLNNVEVRFIA